LGIIFVIWAILVSEIYVFVFLSILFSIYIIFIKYFVIWLFWTQSFKKLLLISKKPTTPSNSQPKAPAKSQKLPLKSRSWQPNKLSNRQDHRYQSRTICLMFFQILLSSFIIVNKAFFFPEVDFYCVHSITDDQGITNVAREINKKWPCASGFYSNIVFL